MYTTVSVHCTLYSTYGVHYCTNALWCILKYPYLHYKYSSYLYSCIRIHVNLLFITLDYVQCSTFRELLCDFIIFVSVDRVELRAPRARSQNRSPNRSLPPLSLLVNRPRRKLRTDVNSYLSLLHLSYNSNFDTFLSPIHLQPHLLISFILTLVVFSHL